MEKALNKKIVISGATGLVGSHLLRLLSAEGYTNIVAIRRSNSSDLLVRDLTPFVQWVEGDILDVEFVNEITQGARFFIHTAGKISFDPAEVSSMYRVNVQGTAHVVHACLSAGVEKLVHVSSVAALGRPVGRNTLDETEQWSESPHNTPYARSKYHAELEIYRGIAEGLRASLVLPGTILGAGDWNKGSARLFDVVAKGIPYYPVGTNGFVDVRDVTKICSRLMLHPDNGGRWITCSASISYRELLHLMASALHVKPLGKPLARPVAEMAMLADYLRAKITRKPRFFSRASYMVSRAVFHYDNQKVKRELDYRFIPLSRTIREVAQAYLIDKRNE